MARHERIGNAIRSARKRRGWSQDELARRVGASGRLTVIRWEQGIHRPTDYVDQLADVLGLEPELLADDDSEDRDVYAPLTRAVQTIVEAQVEKALKQRVRA